MSTHDFLSAALSSTIESLSGGDEITIGSKTITSILDPIQEVEDLMMGGEGDLRSVTCLVQSSDIADSPPQKGDGVQLQGQEWKIHSIDYHQGTTTRLTLHSPARRV